jgi:hypothetical protein
VVAFTCSKYKCFIYAIIIRVWTDKLCCGTRQTLLITYAYVWGDASAWHFPHFISDSIVYFQKLHAYLHIFLQATNRIKIVQTETSCYINKDRPLFNVTLKEDTVLSTCHSFIVENTLADDEKFLLTLIHKL